MDSNNRSDLLGDRQMVERMIEEKAGQKERKHISMDN